MSSNILTEATVVPTLRRLADYLDTLPPEQRGYAAICVDEAIWSMYGQDLFGTEGQLDPRATSRS